MPDSHRYIGVIVISKIVISGFCPIHFTVTLPGQNFHRYIENIVISKIVISVFHCIIKARMLTLFVIIFLQRKISTCWVRSTHWLEKRLRYGHESQVIVS